MIKKGNTFYTSHGLGGGYRISAIMIALKDFDYDQLVEDYPHKKDNYKFEVDEFSQWLIDEGYSTKIEAEELYTGSHGWLKLTA